MKEIRKDIWKGLRSERTNEQTKKNRQGKNKEDIGLKKGLTEGKGSKIWTRHDDGEGHESRPEGRAKREGKTAAENQNTRGMSETAAAVSVVTNNLQGKSKCKREENRHWILNSLTYRPDIFRHYSITHLTTVSQKVN